MSDIAAEEAATAPAPAPASYRIHVPAAPAAVREPDADLLGGGDQPRRLGHHVLLHELGRGGMGVVYAAYDVRLYRRVALKVLRRQGDSAQRRLVREAQALARLSHPNVVQIYETGDVDGQAFLAIEFIDGTTLRPWLAERRPRSEILTVFAAAGRGLAAAHACGLVHRDFKPDNVMLRRDGRVLVTDFGLVRGADCLDDSKRWAPIGALRIDLTQAGAVMGTPGYMPPEQFCGREVDARSDQFSFCVALWEALYGQRPFTGPDARAVEDAILHGKRTEPAGADVPPWLREILVRGLACEPTDRWQTMDDLLAALARDPTPRRRASRLVGGVVLATLLTLGLGLAVRRSPVSAATVAACDQAGAAITADWNDRVAAGSPTRFLATGRSHAAEAWSHARPWLRPQVAALQLRLQRITACRLTGAHEEALAQALALLPDALASGWPPLVAQVRLEIGFGQIELGSYELARTTLEQSFVDATTAGDELGMSAAATKLSHLVGHVLGQDPQGRVWGDIAAALLARQRL